MYLSLSCPLNLPSYHNWQKKVGLLCLTPLSTIFQYTMSCWSVLLVEEIWLPRENNWPAAGHSQTLSHKVVSSTPRHEWDLNSLFREYYSALMVIYFSYWYYWRLCLNWMANFLMLSLTKTLVMVFEHLLLWKISHCILINVMFSVCSWQTDFTTSLVITMQMPQWIKRCIEVSYKWCHNE